MTLSVPYTCPSLSLSLSLSLSHTHTHTHTHTGPFPSFHTKSVCVPLDIHGIEPILHCRGLQAAQYKHLASDSSSLPPPQPPSSSDPEDTPNLLDEIGGSTSILPVFSTGLISLLLTQKWPSFAVFLSLLTVYLAKGLTTG